MSDVRYEIKNFVTCYLTWNIDSWKSGSVRTQTKRNNKLILVLLERGLLILRERLDSTGWSGRWWRLKRSSTNWSFFNKWFGTGLVVILVLKRLDSAQLSCRDSLVRSVRFSVSARSIDRDSLVKSGLCVRYRIEYRIEPRISTCLLNMNLNKGRD